MNGIIDTNYYKYNYLSCDEIIKIGMDDTDDWDWDGDLICVNEIPFTGYLYVLNANGLLSEYTRYKLGFPFGDSYTFYDNGQPKLYMQRKHANRHGLSIEWSDDGTVLREEIYKYNSCIWRKIYKNDGSYIEEDVELSENKKWQIEMGMDRHELLDKRLRENSK